ncbi:MAG: glycosyltransferase family 2 protein, partial [Deltaproteobacteria bacterium]|nr:glycosyltransferase family 2 protein [Deltaproteobacteria bacterium]
MEKVSVILPAYNEEGNISVLAEKVARAFSVNHIDGEAILIDDGSVDGTGEKAEECARRYDFFRVYHHKKNLGLTKALSNGFRRAAGDIVVFLPSDLQSDPEEDIPKLVEGIRRGADVVVGWRQGRKEFKKFGSKLYNWISKVLFGVTVHDQNWIKAFRKDFIHDLILRSDWHRFLIAIAVHKGCRVEEVKTNWYPRTYGSTKYGFMRIPVSILDMLVLKIEMMFIENPMRFFGTVGGLCFLIGAGIA